MKAVKDRIEYIFVCIFYIALRSLPLDMASYVGGYMARATGPLLPANRTAKKNLERVFPDMPEEKKRRILTGMWDNLGRVAAEMTHLSSDRLYSRLTIHGNEHLPKPGQQVLFFSGHIGNWELLSPIVFRNGVNTAMIYRKANNTLVDDMVTRVRMTQAFDMIPKGAGGAVKLVRTIKNGHSMAMLVDQKMNDGIAVPFFGMPAMTATAIAEFALRYNLPIMPARVIRTRGCHFVATLYPRLEFTPSGDHDKDVMDIMMRINATVEEWVREHPDQWFWVHRRWPK